MNTSKPYASTIHFADKVGPDYVKCRLEDPPLLLGEVQRLQTFSCLQPEMEPVGPPQKLNNFGPFYFEGKQKMRMEDIGINFHFPKAELLKVS